MTIFEGKKNGKLCCNKLEKVPSEHSLSRGEKEEEKEGLRVITIIITIKRQPAIHMK